MFLSCLGSRQRAPGQVTICASSSNIHSALRLVYISMSIALPAVHTFADAVDWSKTVTPYISQLYDLPSQLQGIRSLQALKLLYVSTNPLISAFAFSCALMPIFFVASEINRNWSQVDRFWSILPTIYNVHYALYANLGELPTKRINTLAAISIIWSVRTTYTCVCGCLPSC